LTVATIDAFGTGGIHCEGIDAVVTQLAEEAAEGDTILVKGSRFMRMERVIAAITGNGGVGAH
jgi:UDP-N-acetylmuramoyl-tripeptide--D-alanyl-D-alanine ligase